MSSYAKLSDGDVSEKAANDMVTVVDHASQKIVVDAIRSAYPGDFIVAEEDLSDSVNEGLDPEGGRRWYIDPLDGTTNYVHTYPMFAVNIALEVDRRMSVGVTFAPRDNEMFHASSGGGAYLNGQPMRVSDVEGHNRILLGTGFPFRARQHLDIYLESFSYFFNNARGVRRAGSAALDFAYVACGRLDGFWEMTLSPWDMAAGVVLVEEAGGRVTDFFGGDTFIESGHVVSTNGRFHDWMNDELAKIFSPGVDYTGS
jgi:myo-inositol-1(or 4)-monophosphatase